MHDKQQYVDGYVLAQVAVILSDSSVDSNKINSIVAFTG